MAKVIFMTFEEPKEHAEPKFTLKQAIHFVENGQPVQWRRFLTDISAGLEAGHASKKESAKILVQVVEYLRECKDKSETYSDPSLVEALTAHFENALKQVFDFADEKGLPLAKALRAAERVNESDDRSR